MTTPSSKEHWILRVSPQSQRKRVVQIGRIFGVVCTMIWFLGAFVGLFLGPLAFSVWRPAAPISQPILWLRRISGSEAFILTYTLVMMAFIGIVFTGYSFLDYIRTDRNTEPSN